MNAITFKARLVAVLTSVALALSMSFAALGTQQAHADKASSQFSLQAASKPAKAKITSITVAKKSITVKWKSVKGATAYEVKCTPKSGGNAITKKVSKKYTKATVSGLKSGKKYSVQVRAYKTVNGSKQYGNWSNKSTATTKSATSSNKSSTNSSSTVYITNTGAKFHASGCRSLSKSKIPISRSRAISQGYGPCGICHP